MIRVAWPFVRRYAFDFFVVAGAIEVVAETIARSDSKDAPTGSLWLLLPAVVLLMFVPLLFRRRFPFGAPALVMVSGAALSFVDGHVITFPFAIFLDVIVVSFLFGMLEDSRQALAGLAIVVAAGGIVTHNNADQGVGDFFFIALLMSIVWLAGFALGRRLEQAREVEARAERVAREEQERARRAVTDERARIARELHDVVGHSVSVMTVQAAAVRRLLLPEQEKEREALQVVEHTGRQALAEMRRMVGVLRRPEEAPALAPQPSLMYLDKLVEQVREAGLPVALRVEGEPKPLAPGVDLTAYRLVQEGLTNALKHAKASRADVTVRYSDGDVQLEVSDNGRGAGNGDGAGGHGLVGMRERVSVYGGELDAGPGPTGGYVLRARLPVGQGV